MEMKEEHWCQKCWITKRTVFHAEINGQWLCEDCFNHMLEEAIQELTDMGVVEGSRQ